jgi:hypothetical protein
VTRRAIQLNPALSRAHANLAIDAQRVEAPGARRGEKERAAGER